MITFYTLQFQRSLLSQLWECAWVVFPLLKERHKLQSLSLFECWLSFQQALSSKTTLQKDCVFWNCYIWMFTKGWRFCLNDYNFKEKLAEFCPLYNSWSFHPWHLPPHHCNSLFDFYFISFPLLVLSSILMHGYSLYHLNCFVAGANFHFYFLSTEELAKSISLAYLNLTWTWNSMKAY